MGVKQRILDFLAALDDDADGIGEADVEADEVEADEVDDLDAETDNTPENGVEENIEEDAPEAGTGDTNADEVAADDAEETMPDSEVSVAELRDALGKLGSENERLRSIIAELGGDSALGDEDVAEDVVEDEADDEYDDEAAQKDLDEQKRQIAALSGK